MCIPQTRVHALCMCALTWHIKLSCIEIHNCITLTYFQPVFFLSSEFISTLFFHWGGSKYSWKKWAFQSFQSSPSVECWKLFGGTWKSTFYLKKSARTSYSTSKMIHYEDDLNLIELSVLFFLNFYWTQVWSVVRLFFLKKPWSSIYITHMTIVLIGKGLVLGGLPFENRGHLGPHYLSLSVLTFFWSYEGIGTTTSRSQSKIAEAHSEGFLVVFFFVGFNISDLWRFLMVAVAIWQ